jgi:hypothetical protein
MTATMEHPSTVETAADSGTGTGERARSALVTAARFAGNFALATAAVLGFGGDVDDLVDSRPANRRAEVVRTPER